jgi:aminopeptidase N
MTMRWRRFRRAPPMPCRDALMQEYDDKWHQDGLVMDKWLILQATSPAQNVLKPCAVCLNTVRLR